MREIKTREMFSSLPLINNSVTIGLSFLLLIMSAVVYVIEVTNIILDLFIYLFFLRKDLKRIKSTKRKTSDFYPFTSLCSQKIVAFVVFCSLIFVLLMSFLFVSVFIRAESFREKKNKQV